MLRRVDGTPHPRAEGSDFGQSFLWYGKNLHELETQHTPHWK
jgi:hypothetical protein